MFKSSGCGESGRVLFELEGALLVWRDWFSAGFVCCGQLCGAFLSGQLCREEGRGESCVCVRERLVFRQVCAALTTTLASNSMIKTGCVYLCVCV